MNDVKIQTLPLGLRDAKEKKLNIFLNACLVCLVFLAIFVMLFNAKYCSVYIVESSMSPTLTGAVSERVSGGDYVYAQIGADFTYGDIVVINANEDSVSKRIIKRVVAFGGDSLYLDRGQLYVKYAGTDEFVMINEKYAVYNDPNLAKNSMSVRTVPEGKIFVLGDNRNVSKDSRDNAYGFIDENNVFAVVADWSLAIKDTVTGFNTFINFTIPSFFGIKK